MIAWRRLFFLGWLTWFCCFIPGTLWSANGKLVGRITDRESREALVGASVIIVEQWLGDKSFPLQTLQGAASDGDGYFVLTNVPPGTYNIRAQMMGYQTLVKQQVRVNLDRTITVDFPLVLSAIEVAEQVVVAEKEVIKADISGTQEIIVTDRIDQTPTTRMDEFINKVKGVELKSTTDGNGLSIRGGQIRETDIRLDGVSMRDPRSDNSYLSLNSTTIEEIQVLTGGFEAKYGDMRSGLVNVVTREGSREKLDINFKVDMTPSGQQKYFGSDPWGSGSLINRVFADTSRGDSSWCWLGTVGDTSVPADLRYFKGWNKSTEGKNGYDAIGLSRTTKLTPDQKRDLWLFQHPQYNYNDDRDIFYEGSISGGLPGGSIPLLGGFLKNTTFILGAKFENTQYVFPLGPRDSYQDWNLSLKLTTRFGNKKVSINGMSAKISSITTGRPSTFGGALLDNSGRFGFMNNSEASVITQAGLLGGNDGLKQMFNKSRLQFYDLRYHIGGIKFTHTLSNRTFYTVEAQFNYTDHNLSPFSLDSTREDAWVTIETPSVTASGQDTVLSIRVLDVPSGGSPNASTNWVTDITDFFWVYGGLQSEDSSYSWAAHVKADYTTQWGKHHQIESGLALRYTYLSVNAGTWLQSKKSWTPDTWNYYQEHPIDMAYYLQDKLEFEGMVANIGLRADYFNPMKKSFSVSHPLDLDYAGFYNNVYTYLPGDFGSWERWEKFRELLEEPTGWPTHGDNSQLKLSPRLGVSFPITVASKLYFNYGHFYQKPNVSFLYNLSIFPGGVIAPTPELPMARTVAYEFGYEQRLLSQFLVNLTMYYKDIKDEPLGRTFVDYNEEIYVTKYFPDAYRDIRGIECRFEKNLGTYFTFWSSYEYMLVSYGETGLSTVYENRLKAAEEARSANLYTSDLHPSAQGNINFHVPERWGPAFGSWHFLGGWNSNFFVEWRDGGHQIINPDQPVDQQKKIDVVDYSNVDFRLSKLFKTPWASVEFVLTIKNLLNQKRLSYWNMTTTQYDRYKQSLHLPYEEGEEQGSDKLGEWDKDHIDTGWFTAPLFLNPRQFYFGLRFSL